MKWLFTGVPYFCTLEHSYNGFGEQTLQDRALVC